MPAIYSLSKPERLELKKIDKLRSNYQFCTRRGLGATGKPQKTNALLFRCKCRYLLHKTQKAGTAKCPLHVFLLDAEELEILLLRHIVFVYRLVFALCAL